LHAGRIACSAALRDATHDEPRRVLVLAHWTIAFLSSGRSERVITAQEVFGRHALEGQVGDSSERPTALRPR